MVLRSTSEPIIKVFRSVLTAISYAQKMVSHKIRKIKFLRGMKTIHALYKHGRTINKYYTSFSCFPFLATIVNCKRSFSFSRIYQKSEVNTAKPVCFSTQSHRHRPLFSSIPYYIQNDIQLCIRMRTEKICQTEVPPCY